MAMTGSPAVLDKELPHGLVAEMAHLSSLPVAADFSFFVEELRARFGVSLDAVLLYGSCLRAREIADGIADFYVVVNSYHSAYRQSHLASLNAWLPPNVFYLEISAQEKTLRAKYAVVSTEDFERGTRRWFHPYLWARFAQPVRLLYVRDEIVRQRIHFSLAHAVTTFLDQVVSAFESGEVTVEEIWSRGLSLTYAAELRPERETRARLLAQLNLDDYARLTAYACAGRVFEGRLIALANGNYRCEIGADTRLRSLRHWKLRRWQGRILSILRLAKAAFTFQDGISYAVWKIERHTGVHVEVSPMLRRHPVLWGYKVFWKLLRRGLLR
jgi:hypothetical protein